MSNHKVPTLNFPKRYQQYHLFRWAQDQGYLSKNKEEAKRKENAQRLRFTAFDGGVIDTPYAVIPQILEQLAKDIEAKHVVCWQEIAYGDEAPFRLLLEFDYNIPLTEFQSQTVLNMLVKHMKQAQVVVQKYVPMELTRLVVLTAPPRRKDTKAQKMVRVGTHLIFPDICITQEQGRQITHHVKMSLSNESKTLDVDSIYDNKQNIARLRCMGCCKTEPCGYCKNEPKNRLICTHCNQRGQMIRTSSYGIQCILNPDGTMAWEPSTQQTQPGSTLECLQMTTIYPGPEAKWSTYKQPDNAPLYIKQELQSRSRDRYGNLIPYLHKGEAKPAENRKQIEDVGLLELIRKQVVAFCPEQYRECTILAFQAPRVIFIEMVADGRHYCLRKQGSHSRNRVFFRIGKQAKKPGYNIYAHCHNKQCKDLLKQNPIARRLDPYVVTTLFPTEKQPQFAEDFRTVAKQMQQRELLKKRKLS